MKFLVAQIVRLRVIAIRAGDNLQVLTTLTGEGNKEKHQVWAQGPVLITHQEQHRYVNENHVTFGGGSRKASLPYWTEA